MDALTGAAGKVETGRLDRLNNGGGVLANARGRRPFSNRRRHLNSRPQRTRRSPSGSASTAKGERRSVTVFLYSEGL
jgi:hypothetical protein